MSTEPLRDHLEIETLKLMTYEKICNLMNEYDVENCRVADENERLKKDNESLKYTRPKIFATVGQIILLRDVEIQKDLNGFKKFVVNGKMLQSTDRLFDELTMGE